MASPRPTQPPPFQAAFYAENLKCFIQKEAVPTVPVGAALKTFLAERFNWQRSRPLDGQKLAVHKKWLACWERIEVMDMHHFPLWEEEAHNILQQHFADLESIFLGYTRSISETSAEDALEMSMSEFKDFVTDCGLVTKDVSFELMTNTFIKANATNSAQVRAQHADGRRNAAGKANEAPAKATKKVKGTNDGAEAKKDQELVLYEFIAMLIRISFQIMKGL